MNHKTKRTIESLRKHNDMMDDIKAILRNAGYNYSDVTPLTFVLISTVKHASHLGMTGLADYCGVKPSTVEATLSRAVMADYIITYFDEPDGSIGRPTRRYALQPKGERLIAAFNTAQEAIDSGACSYGGIAL